MLHHVHSFYILKLYLVAAGPCPSCKETGEPRPDVTQGM